MSFVPDRVWFIHSSHPSIPYRHPPSGGPPPCGSSRMVAGRNDPDEECNGHDCDYDYDDDRVGKNHGNPCNGGRHHRECHHYYKRHRTVGRTRCTPAMDNGYKNCRGRNSDTLVSVLLLLWLGTRVSSNGTDGRRAVEWWGEPPPFRRTTVWFEYDDDYDYYYYSAMAMMMIK